MPLFLVGLGGRGVPPLVVPDDLAAGPDLGDAPPPAEHRGAPLVQRPAHLLGRDLRLNAACVALVRKYFTSAVDSSMATTRVCSPSATHTAAAARQKEARTVRWASRCRRPDVASAGVSRWSARRAGPSARSRTVKLTATSATSPGIGRRPGCRPPGTVGGPRPTTSAGTGRRPAGSGRCPSPPRCERSRSRCRSCRRTRGTAAAPRACGRPTGGNSSRPPPRPSRAGRPATPPSTPARFCWRVSRA